MAEPKERNEENLDAMEPLNRGPDDIRAIIRRILTLEQERLYMRKPHLNDDIIRVIKDEIK